MNSNSIQTGLSYLFYRQKNFLDNFVKGLFPLPQSNKIPESFFVKKILQLNLKT